MQDNQLDMNTSKTQYSLVKQDDIEIKKANIQNDVFKTNGSQKPEIAKDEPKKYILFEKTQ